MAVPILKSSSITRSLAFYVDVLGARLAFSSGDADPAWTDLELEGHELTVSSFGDGAFGSAAYLRVPDVDAFHRRIAARGWQAPADRGPADREPTDQSWGMRELFVRDPDGNKLIFGSPLAAAA
jgi:catechol 2,3-dioxygenase-like lactoylglutathione lyase family enzyme